MNRTIQQICRWWRNRCAERRMSTIPGYPRDTEISNCRQKHGRVNDLVAQRQEAILRALRGRGMA